MIADQYHLGKIVRVSQLLNKWDKEYITIEATTQGIRIQRDRHISMFISYQGLVELLDCQQILKT